ncbi:porin [Capnocytophaga canimorsus]|uniref:porin n=1 Tax=Capnocytophaga canimorsus TaxID=28188 RepID=UPI001561D417|nr:porin [Capnocytophaga canimorsus]
MKNLYLAMAFLLGGVALAQQGFQEQIDELKQKSDKFNVFLNFQSSFDVINTQDVGTEAYFKARQLRLEFRGNINERIFYRLRHRLNKSNAGADLDNLARATDLMYAGFRLNEKWTLTAGKMCQAWGGFEFDLNPMNIYEYSDFIENMDNFMVGGMLTYAPDANHEINFQITDVRNNPLDKVYEGKLPAGVEKSKSPLTYIINWNGNLWDGKFQTRWAIGLENEAKNHNSMMVTLGNRLNLDHFQVFFDYMMAKQDLDRLGYASVYSSGLSHDMALQNTTYNTFILKAEYQPDPKWNLFAKGMYETARVDKSKMPTGFVDNERNSMGYYLGVEYLPFSDQDLRFFLTYVGRQYDYKHGQSPDTNRVSLGMMYRIKAF